LARFAADLDTARANSRELTALWAQLVDAHRTARAAADPVCQWCRRPVAKPTWWDGLPQCPDPHRCERQRRTARADSRRAVDARHTITEETCRG
jgi:hypothetical protein